MPMVKVSTLFHRVDGFDESGTYYIGTATLDRILHGDHLLEELLGPLNYDPGEELVQAILEQS
jgi:hypothetical protein